MNLQRSQISFCFTVVISICIAGCEVQNTESSLTEAGFEIHHPDSPRKMAYLESMPQNILVSFECSGKTYYLYADNVGCNCLYIGNEEAYRKYAEIRADIEPWPDRAPEYRQVIMR